MKDYLPYFRLRESKTDKRRLTGDLRFEMWWKKQTDRRKDV